MTLFGAVNPGPQLWKSFQHLPGTMGTYTVYGIFSGVLGSLVILESAQFYPFLLFVIIFLFLPLGFSSFLVIPLYSLCLHICVSFPFPTGKGLWLNYQLVMYSSLKGA